MQSLPCKRRRVVVTKRRMWHPETGAEMAMDMATFERWADEMTLANQARQRAPMADP